MKKLLGTLSIISAAPLLAIAHPGHGGHEGGYTIIHYFIEPVHAIVSIGCIVTTIAFVAYKRKRSQKC